MIRRAMTRHYSTRHDMTFVFYTRTSTCHVMSCFTHAFHVLEAHVRISLLFQRGRATPSTHLVRDIIVCRKTSDHLRMAALLLLEAASRSPPALLLLEDVRAPPHTEHPPRRENLLLPARAVVTLAFPSWTPPSSPPLPMRTAALPLRLAWLPPPAPRSLLTRALAPAQALVASWTLIRASRSSLPPPLSLLRRTVPAFRRPSLHRHLLAAPGIRGRPPAQQRVWVARLCHHLRAANAMPPRLLFWTTTVRSRLSWGGRFPLPRPPCRASPRNTARVEGRPPPRAAASPPSATAPLRRRLLPSARPRD